MGWVSGFKKKAKKGQENRGNDCVVKKKSSIISNSSRLEDAVNRGSSESLSDPSLNSSSSVSSGSSCGRHGDFERGKFLQPDPATNRQVLVVFQKGTVDNDPSTRFDKTVSLLNDRQCQLFMADYAAMRMRKELAAQRKPRVVRANERFYQAYEAY